MLMRVLLAFDKFKDALSASQACETAASALRERHPEWTLDLCPLTDGGDGFEEVLRTTASGQRFSIPVNGPRGHLVDASFSLVAWPHIPARAQDQLKLAQVATKPGPLAVIEMATASGLALLTAQQRDPWQTSTYGTGQLIRAATENGASAILLGVGGSATSDLGLGALSALGLEFLTESGATLRPPLPAFWSKLTHIRGTVPNTIPPIRIACDVVSPLFGPLGAAATYGRQKGLAPTDLPAFENQSSRIARLLCNHTGRSLDLAQTPGAGAAGGITFGLMCAAKAELLSGFDLVTAWLNLEKRIAAADLIITGEGRFDQTSFAGKGPGAIVSRALALGKPVHVFAGQVTAASVPGLTLQTITPEGTPLAEALRDASLYLYRAFSSIEFEI